MIWRVISVLAVAVATAGCYPALMTQQPDVKLTVRDTRGVPVSGASFTLATYRFPFPTPGTTTFAKFATDAAGGLRVPKRRDLLVQVALPDGGRWYNWAYCIEKPGYRAIAAVEPDLTSDVSVVLEESATPSVCKWPTADQSYYQVEVGEP